MRICIIGKFPPIQGGVSMRTYWTAHGLGALGHEVHVVTNAREAVAPHRMHMRPQDWEQCSARYDIGSVTVHWTDPVDRSQAYIPMASPFTSKLAGLAARASSERPFDVIYSHYLEPYGVAGLLAAQMTGAPHVVRMAGSDAGRLWHHPQIALLYDHVLRSAEAVIAAGSVAERAIERGVSPDRIVRGGGLVVPEALFTPEGPKLDIQALRAEVEVNPELCDLIWGNFTADRPYFGVYGKLGERKGSFALLAAMRRLILSGLNVGLLVLAHGRPTVQTEFRARVKELGLADHVLQLPFLPHWRVPEFLRGCLAVCCLEQDFPIVFHSPIIAREVLLCGTCLVSSTEVIRKLPSYERLPHGYGCIAIADVNDIDALSEELANIARNPGIAAAIGARGRKFALEIQRYTPSLPLLLLRVLEAAARREKMPRTVRGPARDSVTRAATEAVDGRFRLTRLILDVPRGSIADSHLDRAAIPPGPMLDASAASQILASLKQAIDDGHEALRPLAAAVRIELALAGAEDDPGEGHPTEIHDPLFRLKSRQPRRWAESDFARLVPIRDSKLRIIEFDFDVSDFLGAQTMADFPADVSPVPSYMIAFRRLHGQRREPLVVDLITARILMLSNGIRTAADIVKELEHKADVSIEAVNLEWIENLFVCGLISLRNDADIEDI